MNPIDEYKLEVKTGHKCEAEIERYNVQKAKGHISYNWEITVSDGVLCDGCFSAFTPENFPIVEGRCGHTLCGDCFRQLRKKSSAPFHLVQCPVQEKCSSGSFNLASPRVNKVAMNLSSHLAQTKKTASTELKALHDDWTRHVCSMEIQYEDMMQHVEEVKEAHMKGADSDRRTRATRMEKQKIATKEIFSKWKKAEQSRHESVEQAGKEEITALKESVESWKEDCLEKKLGMAQLKHVLKLWEGGTRHYYLRCPGCKIYVQKIPRRAFTDPIPHGYLKGDYPELPRDDIPSISGWFEVDDFAPFRDLTMWVQMQQSDAYKKMRQHLKKECIPKQSRQLPANLNHDQKEYYSLRPALERDLPAFYQECPATAPLGSFVRRVGSNDKRKAQDMS